MKTATRPQAFTLVEMALALGVSSFCLVSIFGLLSAGLTTSQAALEQTAAQGIVSSIASELRATPTSATTSPYMGVTIPASPTENSPPSTVYFNDAGAITTAGSADSRYLATVSFFPNGTGSKAATFASIKVSWPAAAGEAHPAGSVSSFQALDRN